MSQITIPQELRDLETAYKAAGHDLWLVGGCVRDHILGLPAKDVDLTTTATPDEQIEICNAIGLKWFGTGLQHGTLTIVAGTEAYEITTLRTDVETDGRHATVAYTRDLVTDLERRDLTMNAIAMTLDGEITDPFGGVDDALSGQVRFVGDAASRIREDYLRILRWFRFLGRFATELDPTNPDLDAIRDNAAGLSRISVERVWSELSRILSGPQPARVIALMRTAGVLGILGVPAGNADQLTAMRPHTGNPALLLAAWLGADATAIAACWKASNAEREATAFASDRLGQPYDLARAKLDLVDGADAQAVDAVLRTNGNADTADALRNWIVPTFPIQGRDLLRNGMKPGKEVGMTLARMREAWIASGYALSAQNLLER